MSSIHKTLLNEVTSLSRKVVYEHLNKKLTRAGLDIPRAAVEALADHLLSKSDEPFTWIDGQSGKEPEALRDLTLNFDEADATELDVEISKITDKLPEIVSNIIEKGGLHYFEALKKSVAHRGSYSAVRN